MHKVHFKVHKSRQVTKISVMEVWLQLTIKMIYLDINIIYLIYSVIED